MMNQSRRSSRSNHSVDHAEGNNNGNTNTNTPNSNNYASSVRDVMNAYLTAPYERVIKTTFRLDAEDNQKHRLRKRFSSLMRSSTTQSTAAAGDDDDDNDDPDELQAMKRKATQLYKAYAEHEETSPPSSCAAGENGNNLKQVREEEEDDVDQIPGPLAYLQRTSPENQGTCSFSCHVLLACLLASCLIPIFTYKYSVQWKQETAVLLDNANARANASSSLSFSSEQQAFPLLLENHAKEEWDTLQEVLQSQADAMTADILQSTNAPFPYHALSPYWEKTGQHVRKQVPFLQTVGWAPLMVDANRMDNWQRFALYQQSSWLSKSYELAGMDAEKNSDTSATTTITSSILNTNETTTDQHVFLPVAQLSPPPNNMSNPNLLQADLLTHFQGTNTMLDSFNVPGTSDFFNFTVSDILPNNSSLLQLANLNTRDEHHYSLVLQPVFDSFHDKEKVLKAVIFAIVSWEEFLLSQLQIQQLQSQLQPIHDDNTPEALLFLSSCSNKQVPFPSSASSIATATATAMDPIEMDHSDIHIIEFDTGTTNTNTKTQPGSCRYTLQVQIQTDSPSKTRLNEPLLSPTGFALIMAAVLLLLGCFLWILIIHLQWRYYQLHTLATSATNVLATMFPAKVCDRILNEELEKQQRRQFHDGISSNSVVDESDVNGGDKGNHVVRCMQTTKPNDRSQSFGVEPPNSMDFSMRDNCDSSHHENYDNMILKTVDQSNKYKTKPIADLFPEATVLFADIVGFTAWSSTREPCQVFDLLETIYHTFDEIAKKRHVFKVETIGDCYVAVTGIPVPRKDHAVQMCKFARDCLHAMEIVTAQLEVALGPDTSDLSMRFGLHSGPVTAGVLRGERSRFQLFGDTVNTAARMESNGMPGRIHLSQETANLLKTADKGHWFLHRDGKIHAKGKGELQTYWLDPMAVEVHNQVHDSYQHPTLLQASSIVEARQRDRDLCQGLVPEKEQRLIDWVVDQLYSVLKQIEAKRHMQQKINEENSVIPQAQFSSATTSVFEEVQEIIKMPPVDPQQEAALQNLMDPESVELHPDVKIQLNDFVTSISTLYRSNPFHNFEHAVHVTLSVTKMLSRIVSGPMAEKLKASASATTGYESDDDADTSDGQSIENDAFSHDFGLEISADPLCHFAVIFSALIHDVDHLGVSNAQLIKENSHLARVYKNQSIAEQNSVNISWDMLMDPAFADLRNCIYKTEEEFVRFRQLVVNAVMATDIVDKDLKALRNARWEKAFQNKAIDETMTKEDVDRRSTIVIEHLIQASDVAHTMQHWQVYLKWNERLFKELYKAFKKGRMDKNPLEFWHQGEIGFFDFYIIPLAKKLRDCGVFGVSCDEYLNYAMKNRDDWEKTGTEVVERYREWTIQVDEQEERQAAARKTETA